MEFTGIATAAAKAGGAILRSHFESLPEVRAKGHHDVVSDADVQSEQKILDIVNAACPDHAVVAEESGGRDTASPYTWYVDPMDGTNCFVMGVPYFSVSVALAHRGEVVVGVVYNPLQDELYVAERGGGAFRNGERIAVSDCAALEEALVGSGYEGEPDAIRSGLRMVEAVSLRVRKVTVHFSPALDLCNIARGRMHAYVDEWTTPEDHAAGSLIVTEAGGRVQDFGRDGWRVGVKGIVASNGPIHDALTALL
ncbi:MAG: inositol monophosphatase [Candidatus Hydrogenedentes bacterium]|nr:inositol monophosphatase [Candidatus Hydrogenedentota bacterium]